MPSPLLPELIVRLCDLRPGDRGRIERADLCHEECELLRAMGLCEECEVKVCRSGEPCIVQVDRTRLGLSVSVSRDIMVRRPAAENAGT